MKHISLLSLLVLALTIAAFAPLADTYTVDVESSKVKWTGYHLAKSYEHFGYVGIKSGSIEWDSNQITGGTVIIDMNSLTNTDIEDEKSSGKLVRHLKSDDFFAVKEHPEAKLTIKGSEKISGSKYKVDGDLTIRGITHPISFEADIKSDKKSFGAISQITVERSKYEVSYGWTVENAVLSDEFTLDIDLKARR